MKNCWPDGDLRAYVDGELTAAARGRIAVHLAACPACEASYREIAERTAWVSAVMALSESTPRTATPRRRSRRWRMAVLPLAAAFAIAFTMLPKRAPVRPAPVARVVVPPVSVPIAAPVARPVVHRPVPRTSAPSEEFLRLDDDPIETATIVRVSADNGALQAELIIGPDGRAHAIRLVANR
jgi:anti-sigma factor RsiW